MTGPAVVDLDHLEPGLRAWVESLATSGPVLLRRDGQTIATLTYSSAVLEGTIVPAPATKHATKGSDLREGAKVLATTMRLSGPARELLRQSFGLDWVVLDFHDAPDTADVVLTCAHSPQLTHRWTLLFPHAQIIVTEILDPEFGLDMPGPVGRLLDAGAHAYLPPKPLEQVAKNVQLYLAGRAHGALGSSPPATHQLDS
ncbi:hypothetical protein [Phycicoccus sp. Soil748]|uniref:hypothetical protein n=1 Tax=Phycicoccus sp. Soil748 TaxID=1736397 RepID=UPI0007038075|nr:hypothetical protein [Phycicoccus sp. Soil748]KRE54673.1 hypothetical protein ASG70_10995 [Phycicoccus sp. Soil748]